MWSAAELVVDAHIRAAESVDPDLINEGFPFSLVAARAALAVLEQMAGTPPQHLPELQTRLKLAELRFGKASASVSTRYASERGDRSTSPEDVGIEARAQLNRLNDLVADSGDPVQQKIALRAVGCSLAELFTRLGAFEIGDQIEWVRRFSQVTDSWQ